MPMSAYAKAVLLALVAAAASGCSVKWIPNTESALNPPVAFQQQLIAEAVDDVFATMDFSRMGGELVDIEVMGVYADGDVADYLRGKLQLELAKAGAMTEVGLVDRIPGYKANIMLRYGGVNDLVKSTGLYEWRLKQFTYDVEVVVFNVEGKDYFVQTGQGENAVTISRAFYLLFFPVPLPTEWSLRKGRSLFQQGVQTYDAGKRGFKDSGLRRDRGNVMPVLPAQ
jgi:hypothetical protein